MNKNVSNLLLFAGVGVVVGLLGVVTGLLPLAPSTAVVAGALIGAGAALLLGLLGPKR